MTVQATASELIFYPGTAMAAQTLTSISFIDAGELEVWALGIGTNGADVLLSRDVHYAITGDGTNGTANIAPLAARGASEQWLVQRKTDVVQTDVYPPHQPIPAKTLEGGLDRLTRIAQELTRDAGHALRVPRGEDGLTLPDKAARAGKFQAYDADGNPTAVAGTDAASASAGSAAASANTATTQAGIATAQAVIATTQASTAAIAAALAATQAGAVAAALNSSNAPFANAYAATLPKGVLSVTIGGAAITGATPGEYPITGTDGSITGYALTLVVTSATAAFVRVDGQGLGTGTTPPTLSKPAGATLPAGTTLTAVVGSLIPDQRTYWVASPDSAQIQLYGNNGGSVAAAPFGGTQVVLYGKASIDALVSNQTEWVPKTLTYTKGQRVKTDGTLEASNGYAIFGCAIDSSDLAHRITVYTIGSGFRVASYYSDPTGAVGSYISSSVETGNVLRDKLTLTPPSNARYVRINSQDFPSANYVVPVYETSRAMAVSAQIGDTRGRMLTAAALANLPTPNSGQRLNADGTVSTAAGYGNALVVLADDTTSLVIDTYVIGTGNPAIVWYSDAAGTTMLLPGVQTGGASATRVQATLARPAGAVSARVSYSTSNPYSISRIRRWSSVNDVLAAQGLDKISASLVGPVRQTPNAPGILQSQRIDPNTGAVAAAAGYTCAFYAISDLTIPVLASGSVIGTGRYLATFYSDTAGTVYLGQQFLGGAGAGTAYDKQVLTMPPETRCIGINGSTANPPQLFFNTVPGDIVGKMDVVDRLKSTWAGKNLTTEGDSITANNNWQAALVQRLGMNAAYTNTGVGGTRVAYRSGFTDQAQCMCDDARVNAIPATTNLLIFMGGTNDHGQNIPLGTLTAFNVRSAGSFDPYTFYGALELTALKHKTRLPAKRILWAGQTYTDRSGAVPSGWANGLINTLGLSASDYSDACEAVARKWGIPFIRMISECGWDSTNISSFVGLGDAGGVYIHPTQAGADIISNVFFGRIRQIEPIA